MQANSWSSVSSASNTLQGIQHIAPPDASAPPFPSPGSDHEQDKEEQDPSAKQEIQYKQELKDTPEIFRLTLDKNFKDMLDRFLITGHEKILSLRSEVRKSRDVKESSLYFTGLVNEEGFQRFRKYLYQVQVELFTTPKGARLDSSI